jgi:hypothetical protein
VGTHRVAVGKQTAVVEVLALVLTFWRLACLCSLQVWAAVLGRLSVS